MLQFYRIPIFVTQVFIGVLFYDGIISADFDDRHFFGLNFLALLAGTVRQSVRTCRVMTQQSQLQPGAKWVQQGCGQVPIAPQLCADLRTGCPPSHV